MFGAIAGGIASFFFSSRRRHTSWTGDWSSDVCSSDLRLGELIEPGRTALVALMAANNEVGTLQPVAAAAGLAHAAGAVVLCDAVQAARHPGIDMAADGLDLVALASHKLGGPAGVGALVTRAGLPLRPLVHGGGQERGM